LRSCTRDADTLARVGSDEFLVVCEEVDLAPGTLPTTENLREAFSSPLVLDRTRETIEITFSIGSSSIGDRTVPSARRLLDQAEEALARARRRGPGSYAHHSGDLAKTNGHRAASSIELLNAEPAETNGKPAEPSPTEELVRHMYDLWGPGKPDEWISCFHDEIEYIPSAGLSGFDAIYRGHEGMRRFWSHKEDGWESTEVVLLHFEERGDNFVVFVLASLVMKGTGAQIEVSLHQGGKMRDGLIYRLGGYESRTEAFQALEARD
ncbi:MAG: hypothetical protein QOD60_864, partial [Solirubrobacterales bacterium]|nr:hypothetical protein [Solirubrobacterales bacterium]